MPHYLSLTGYVSYLLEKALDGGNTMAESPTGGRSLLNKEEEERVRVREDAAPKPSWDKAVTFGLTPHEDLIRDFWRAKKGSKGERAWNLLMKQLESIKVRYGNDVVREQLELAINGRWTSITLANYEKFKPKTEGKDFSKFAHLTGMSFG